MKLLCPARARSPKGASRSLYELPANKYVVPFGEVNEFMLSQIIDIDSADDEYLLLYPTIKSSRQCKK
jgi:hypothetical protein